jgi:hypothetical protein
MHEGTDHPKPRQHVYGWGIVVNPPVIEGYATIAQDQQQVHAVGTIQERSQQ